MQHDCDLARPRSGDLPQRRADPRKPFPPALPAVTGDQQAARSGATRFARRQSGRNRPNGIDARIAGHMNHTADAFAAQVGGAQLGRSEKEVGSGIDRYAELFLRPRTGRIVRSQTGLDMSKRDCLLSSRKRSAESARRVALNDDEIAPVKRGTGVANDGADELVRIAAAKAGQPHAIIRDETVVGRVERRMLPRQNEAHIGATRGNRRCDWGKLDGFRASADDQRNSTSAQLSPWLGSAFVRAAGLDGKRQRKLSA
jgi:hypothetical protein